MLTKIWSATTYEDHVHELLQLMLKFELCYELSKKGKYLIPQLLPASRPDDFEWDYTNNLQLHYDYAFMPRGLLSRLIVRMHDYAQDLSRAWKSGVVLTKDNTHAFMEEVYGSGKLEIRVIGSEPRDFMVIIAEFIEQLSNEFEGIQYKKCIPCICSECIVSAQPHFYDFKDAKKALAKRKDLRCLKSFEDVNARKLIDNIGAISLPSSPPFDMDGNDLRRAQHQAEIHIHNHLSPSPPALPKPKTEAVLTPPVPPQKFYKNWIVKVIGAGFGVGLFVGICAWWFEWCHFFSAFLIGFGATVFGLFLKGNPERRFFKWGVFCIWGAVGIMAFPFEFASNTNIVMSWGTIKLMFNFLSDWDWLFVILLMGTALFLFFLDYKRDRS